MPGVRAIGLGFGNVEKETFNKVSRVPRSFLFASTTLTLSLLLHLSQSETKLRTFSARCSRLHLLPSPLVHLPRPPPSASLSQSPPLPSLLRLPTASRPPLAHHPPPVVRPQPPHQQLHLRTLTSCLPLDPCLPSSRNPLPPLRRFTTVVSPTRPKSNLSLPSEEEALRRAARDIFFLRGIGEGACR